jgi:2-amino-4-hydroxy-6-hydroxymethyldihydropteridine diphosphokinase
MSDVSALNKHITYLALGSNIENRQDHLVATIARLREIVDLYRISSIYETEPVGYLEQPSFLNMVCGGETHLSAQELLHYVKALERSSGRQPTFRNGPRTIDIDILLYDHLTIEQEDLIIPHPRMSTRAFVLVPLAEIAPDILVPGSGKTIHELLKNVSQHGVQKFAQKQ